MGLTDYQLCAVDLQYAINSEVIGMVRYLTDGEKYALFFCDGCGKPLVGDDPGEPHFPDYEQFLEDVYEQRDDPSQCRFLCRTCYKEVKEQQGEEQPPTKGTD
jgi:hypothetical protein